MILERVVHEITISDLSFTLPALLSGTVRLRYKEHQHSSGTLHDLLHLGLQPGMVGIRLFQAKFN